MSFFAGVYALDGELDQVTPLELVLSARAASARHGRVARFADRRLLLYHVDLQVFGSDGYLEEAGTVAALAGEPYLPRSPEAAYCRSTDLARLTVPALTDHPSLLAQANGTFALCSYSQGSGSCVLAVDALGARPLYYWSDGRQLFFSTALRVLEGLPEVPKRADLGAYLEQEALCYPLGRRTLYADIRVLRDGEYIHAQRGRLRLESYHSWADAAGAPVPADRALARCHGAFQAAVADRVRSHTTQRSLLSGGLDSRCVVACIQQLGAAVETATLDLPGTQDHTYAWQFARTAGVPIRSVPLPRPTQRTTAGATTAALLTTAAGPWAPATVFSGDGGGETMGFLLVEPRVIELLERNRQEEAIAAHLRPYALPRLLRPSVAARLGHAPGEGVREELAELIGLPPDKRLQLFALRNDMRRHLHDYFEQVLETGIELLLPFYDRRFIDAVVRIPSPLTPHLQHRLYHEWLGLMPRPVRDVPWQSYPGHEPSPLRTESWLIDQWESSRRQRRVCAKHWLRAALRGSLGNGFPKAILRRRVLFSAVALHAAGLRNCDHVFKSFLNLRRLLRKSSAVVTSAE